MLLGECDVDGVVVRLVCVVGVDYCDSVRGMAGMWVFVSGPDAVAALRVAYRRELFAIVGWDLVGDLWLCEVTEVFVDLVGYILQVVFAVVAAGLLDSVMLCWLVIIAMGKVGGWELNYVSDVDVVFVVELGELDGVDVDVERALVTVSSLVGEMMWICHVVVWEVDVALRLEGK